MNSKNKAAKKNLLLAYAQGNHSAYLSNMEKMARCLLSQYKNKNINPNNNPCDKTEEKNGKKGDDAKSEDKDNNNTCTVDAHVGEMTSAQDNAGATSNILSIGAHVSGVTETNVPLTQSVHVLLAAHPVDDPIWDCTGSCDILIDIYTPMAGSHIAELDYVFVTPMSMQGLNTSNTLWMWYLILLKKMGSTNLWTNTTNGKIRQTQLLSITIQ